ncbi:MAG: hypothetical protein GEV03_18925 [Streptosporangiales bacterium]|nr:hypothetical protein [Streptosporangiales bacterium]
MTDLTPLQAIGIFAGIPIGLFLLISLLVAVPSWARDARYRPGLPWDAEPVWFDGPDTARGSDVPEEAEESAARVERKRDGGRDGGGASAGW